ncbi:692923f1-c2ab-4731-831b-ffa9d9263d66 [Thermothielavioides terrestris]|uniref:692923f1-c2ab-4731-831b-ffa9d9263d66 n=1 Tax=Thermothielavioides terrestris TaxID=2587410 RepID=A0A3S4AS17_9PEZI|nr:692923f1-c2ab-4731-831b-ffa9d9263d66 [Thermothielavioides terrestris]
MMLWILLTLASGQLALGSPDWSSPEFWSWHPPAPGDDRRGPCPMLNTLANHGFLPHNGRNITKEITVNALNSALNVNKMLGELLFNFAVTTNPQPNATFFDLDHLSRHNILEHDASLSRADYYFGHDDHTFNQTVFDQTKSYWKTPIIDVQQAANARLARVLTSNATNPTFVLSQIGEAFSFGETAAYILALGDRVSGTVPRQWVEYLFENERLPLELGWRRAKEVISNSDLDQLTNRVINATGALANITRKIKVRDFHAGRFPGE